MTGDLGNRTCKSSQLAIQILWLIPVRISTTIVRAFVMPCSVILLSFCLHGDVEETPDNFTEATGAILRQLFQNCTN